MSTKKELLDKPLYFIPNYIYNIMLGSLYFLICNPLLLIFFIVTFIDSSNFNFIFLFIALIPLGPSLIALYLSMKNLLTEKSTSITSYYFDSYKKHFKDTMKIWLIELALLLLLVIDFLYFYIKLPSLGLHNVFLLLGLYLIIVSLYAFPINSRFNIKFKDLIILSFYYTIKKFHITILKTAIIILIIKSTSYIPPLLIVFLPSIIALLFSYYDEKILKDIETKKF